MRILHVHSGNLYGGVETILATLARRQDACRDLQQRFALCFEGRLSRELANLGVMVHSIGEVRVSRPLTLLRSRLELRALLTAQVVDAVVFHSAWSHAIFAPVARVTRLPAVVWMHGTTDGSHWSERWSRRVDPDLVVCNSRFTVSGAAAVYPRTPRRVLYCPLELNGVQLSLSDRNDIRADLDTPADAVVIVQVSRMERGKGQLLHLDVLNKLKTNPDWVCWFVGGPQRPQEKRYFEETQHMAAQLGIAARVRFLNERFDVPRLLRAADIYCQPNLRPESFGITFVEALNAGLPVVTTSTGGANEIVDDTCGLLVRPGNTLEIVKAVRSLIEDPNLRQRLGQGGPPRAKELCDPIARIQELSEILRTEFEDAVPAAERHENVAGASPLT